MTIGLAAFAMVMIRIDQVSNVNSSEANNGNKNSTELANSNASSLRSNMGSTDGLAANAVSREVIDSYIKDFTIISSEIQNRSIKVNVLYTSDRIVTDFAISCSFKWVTGADDFRC